MKIKISTDSTCDLPPEQIEKYDISIIPLYVTKNELSFLDGVEMTPARLFEDVERTGELYKTAAVNVSDYSRYFSEYLKDYDAVIHLNMGSDFSVCYQNACIAAEEFENVYVFDTQNLTAGIGLLVVEAAVMASQGMHPRDILNHLREYVPKVDASFVLNTLKFLHMGGRCSGVAALGANLLNLKPCIEVKDGKMGVGKKYRGNIGKVAYAYAKERLGDLSGVDTRRICIIYTYGISPSIISAVRNAVTEAGKFDEILEYHTGCTISSHCGPDTIGIIYIKK